MHTYISSRVIFDDPIIISHPEVREYKKIDG